MRSIVMNVCVFVCVCVCISVCARMHLKNEMSRLRPHRYESHKMRPIVTVAAWSVCLLVTSMNSAKTAEPIKMPF